MDIELDDGASCWVQLSRGTATDLGLEPGQRVWVASVESPEPLDPSDPSDPSDAAEPTGRRCSTRESGCTASPSRLGHGARGGRRAGARGDRVRAPAQGGVFRP